MKRIIRSGMLPLAFAVGIFFPQLHVLAGIIPLVIRLMLFILFLGIDFSQLRICRSHYRVLVLNLGIGLAAWGILSVAGAETLAQVAFFIGITPTGTAAPVVTKFLGRKVEYVTTALLLNTLGVAVALILFLPLVLGEATPNVFFDVAQNVGGVIFVPLLVAILVRCGHPNSERWPARLSGVIYTLWVTVLAIIVSGASFFIRTHPEISQRVLLEISALALALCVLNFLLGYLAGEPENRPEASQSLGQKNTSITIWLALTYASPLVALGPTLYVLCHNSWNAIQLARVRAK